MSQPEPTMQQTCTPLPDSLVKRLDDWHKCPPKWQHKAYGPLNAYLTIVFPPEHFLVKPQALVREEPAGGVTVKPGEGAVGSDEETFESDEESVDSDEEGVDSDVWSVDSHGVHVNQKRTYPDFCVDQYWGADNDRNPKSDILRIIIEIGSLGRRKGSKSKKGRKGKIEAQLLGYMNTAGTKWRGKLLGVGLLGNEACFIKRAKSDAGSKIKGTRGESRREWISIFDPKFYAELKAMYDYCLAHHEDP
ncbi:hypothetical protein BJ322DRAFT_388797 [Thelephora terrestris]|uniref:Uncharacterized protein n=1 Tax=Thelephora terrestris TaxID=56493 RepID=A0A9P6LA39_9AGAM|nr:hypothetical protein BJ322DRAFT_388797 [Thelephora terrestris]